MYNVKQIQCSIQFLPPNSRKMYLGVLRNLNNDALADCIAFLSADVFVVAPLFV